MTNALFGKPEPAQRELSQMYSVPAYRASVTEKPKWTQIKVKSPLPCDECFAMQHETAGACGPRADAKQRRSFKGGPTLQLCRVHTLLWRDRDEQDAGGTS